MNQSKSAGSPEVDSGELHADPVSRIKNLQELISKEKENLKAQLAHELEKALATYNFLVELGETAVLSEAPISEHVAAFGLRVEPKSTITKGRASISTPDAILKALEGGEQDISTIKAKVAKLKDREVSSASVNQSLGVLKKEGKIVSPSRGRYRLNKTFLNRSSPRTLRRV